MRQRLKLLIVALLFLVGSLALERATAHALSLLTITQTGAAAVVESDEVLVGTPVFKTATTYRVPVSPKPSAVAGATYTVTVTLEDTTTATATTFWTAAQITAAQVHNVDVGPLASLTTQNRFVSVHR